MNVEQYITCHYYDLLKIAKKYTKNDDWASELLHEVLFQILTTNQDKLPVDNDGLKYYITKVLMVNWCQPSSPFYRKIKSFDLKATDIKECMDMVDEDYDHENEVLINILEREFGELDWYNKLIFQNYLITGTLENTSKVTNLTLSGVWNNVTKTKQQLKYNTLNKFNKNV